jgi:phospholipid/cholesterol/gamma-HCH transport system substrate-binding protein
LNRIIVMSRSLSRWQSIVLGVVVSMGLGLASYGLFVLGGRNWSSKDYFHVRAGFRDVRGVDVGTRVRFQGVDAGEVVAIVPPEAPGENVVLRLRIRGDLRPLVRTDASVQVVSEGMIGGKLVDITPGKLDAAGKSSLSTPVEADGLLASKSAPDLNEVLSQVTTTLQLVRDGQGVLGTEIVKALQQTRGTMASFQQIGEAGKLMPIVRNYVIDPEKLLVRKNAECTRYVFAEADLFEPGRAVLTAAGKSRLDDKIDEMHGLLRHGGADMVVLALADPKNSGQPSFLKTLTQQQSEAVCDYLKKHKVHKSTWVTSRRATALGIGADAIPGEESDSALHARVEVRIFVPQD